MTALRPYLIRALHTWIEDNGLTPFILVNAKVPGVQAPLGSAEDGQVRFNLSSRAVSALNIGKEHIEFSARFSGIAQQVWVPTCAVLAVYARENGQGMVFNDEMEAPSPPETPNRGGPGLRVVK